MRSQTDTSHDEVEIAHEAIIHHWPRLRDWLREGGLTRERVRRLKRTRDPDNGHRSHLLSTPIRRLSIVPREIPTAEHDGATAPDPASIDRAEVEVAHEALIRHWPRLREWLDQDRAALLLRESVREAAQEWETHSRDESYVTHRGRRLEAAAALRQHPRLELNAQEWAYLDAAVALREREEQEREAQRQRELVAERERAELAEAARREAEQRVAEQAVAAGRLRRRLLVSVGLGALAVLAAIYAFYNFQEAGEQRIAAEAGRNLAEAAAGTAEAERDRADRQARIAQIQALAAQSELQQSLGQHELGALLARQAYLFARGPSDTGFDAPAGVDRALRTALSVDNFSQILGTQDTPYTVAFSPNGRTVAVGDGSKEISIWDIDKEPAPERKTLQIRRKFVASLAFSPDGSKLAAVNTGKRMAIVWNLTEPDAKPIGFRTRNNPPFQVVTFSPDGNTLATMTGSQISLWNMDRPKNSHRVLDTSGDDISTIAFSPDGRVLAAGGFGKLLFWDLESNRSVPSAVENLPEAEGPSKVRTVAFSDNGKWLASGNFHGTLLLWDLSNPQWQSAFPAGGTLDLDLTPIPLASYPSPISTVAFSPDDGTLAVSIGDFLNESARRSDATIDLIDLGSPGFDSVTLVGHKTAVTDIAFSPDGQILASTGIDDTLRLWNLGGPIGAPLVLDYPSGRESSVAFSPDGRTVVSGSEGGTWLQQLFEPMGIPLRLNDQPVLATRVAVSRDGSAIASSTSDGTVSLWDTTDLKADPRSIGGGACGADGYAWNLAFSPDLSYVAVACGDRSLWLQNLKLEPSGKKTLVGQGVSAMAFSPDGNVLASGHVDGTIQVLRLDQPDEPPQVLNSVSNSDISALAMNGDGTRLAWANFDGVLAIQDLDQPSASPLVLPPQQGGIWSLAMSNDGQTIAVGSSEYGIRLLNLASLADPVLLVGQGGRIVSLVFSPMSSEGTMLASLNESIIYLWYGTDFLSQLACKHVWRNLTMEEWRQFVGPSVPYQKTCDNLPLGEGVVEASDSQATPIAGGASA